ncbi:cytosol aminopeptidase family, catalytic domain protein [Mycobacterium xenopi 3993]|nr:cytosol aminopeptidase family, catalytic domain protein [Mycobacterium xenopi 3993]
MHATAVATAVATARDLVNTPPSHLYPDEFARRAKELGESAGWKSRCSTRRRCRKPAMAGDRRRQGLVATATTGAARPPRLAAGQKSKAAQKGCVGRQRNHLRYRRHIDQTAANMHYMTSDMGGAAAVIATVTLAAQLKLPIDVIATVPMAENMPSGTAQRPGDVLTHYGGTKVEVLNTDAEGRLILADAIVRACEDNPDYLLETSTLTGAQALALGTRTPGVMGSDEFRDRVAAISQRVGENGWPMPLPDELKDDLKSTVADLANVSGQRFAGMLVAGVYLREFVAEGVDWAHIDVATPAYNTGSPWGYTPRAVPACRPAP